MALLKKTVCVVISHFNHFSYQICPKQMLEDHQWLKTYRSSEKDLETKYADDKSNLEKLIQTNNAVKREVMR